ncbi:MAG TPA: acetate--CoA ligase family protein [Pseudonocardia sp.]|nr:acetate--CoA ligase family protein [Pseudonocardia sp.]
MTRVVPAVRTDSAGGAGDGPLAALFAPRGVAVVGASRAAGKLGAVMARSLAGFGGHLALVNPRDDTMYPSVRAAAADGPVDLALLCVPAPACAAAVAEAALGGVRAAVVCAGGFAESGAAGARYQAELAEVAARSGVRLLGPNTSGFLVPGRALTASFVPGVADVPAGRVAVVAASGGVNHALAFLLTEAGHGVSIAVGLGNGADLTAADVLDHLTGDPATSAVALHVESVPDGRALAASVTRLTRVRPVVALVVGRHDVGAFAASHTGALATSWRATRAALAQAGAVLVDDERELVDAVGALSLTRLRPAADPGVGVLTAQAGPGLLLLDDLRGRRARVPELAAATRAELAAHLPPLTYQANPVDTGRPGPGFGAVLGALAGDPEVDLVAGYALHEPDALDLPAAVTRFRAASPGSGPGSGTPLVLGVGGVGAEVAAARRALLRLGVPVADGPRGLAAMTGALLADARARHLEAARTPVVLAAGDWPDPGPGPWDEHRAKALLRALGVPTMPGRACADRAEAHRALTELDGPVAVKLLAADVLHKTELGGVRLGVATPAELDDALDALAAVGARRFLVESMAPPGPDLVLGVRRDPVFGPMVLLGLGGTAAEVLDDVALRLAPLTSADAAAMPDELAGRRLLDGWRGGPRLDRAALASLVVTLGGFLAATPALAEIEINPLRLTAGGLVALDAVCLAAERPGPDGPAAARPGPGEPASERPSGAEEPDGGRAE